MGKIIASRQPEGWRRQDHHRHQPRRVAARWRTAGSSWSTSTRRATSPVARPARSGRPGGHHLRRPDRRTPRTLAGRSSCRPASRTSSLIPADRNLTGAEIELVALAGREDRLRRCSTPCRIAIDYIFIDCPPSLGLLTLNALVAADAVLIPLQCEYFALEGLAELVATMRRVQARLNPGLDIDGVVLTMFDERTNLGAAGRARRARVLQGEGLRDRHPAQRPPRRGAEPRDAGDPLRRQVARRGGLPRARARVARRAATATSAVTRRGRLPGQTLARAQHGQTNDPRSARVSARSSPTRRELRPRRRGDPESTSILIGPNAFQPRSRVRRGAPRTNWPSRSGPTASSSRSSSGQVANDFEIIAGERRWRAAQLAGLRSVPVVVRDVPPTTKWCSQMALIENIQREDLNPIDEAAAYRRLMRRVQPHAGGSCRRRSARTARRSPTACGC